MEPEELLAGFRYANQRFYSLSSAVKRLWASPVQLWWTLPLNLAYMARWAEARWSFSHRLTKSDSERLPHPDGGSEPLGSTSERFIG